MKTTLGTAAAAAAAMNFVTLFSPTPTMAQLMEKQARPPQRVSSRSSIVQTLTPLTAITTNDGIYDEPIRPTSNLENIIGEIRKWSLLKASWDGEGAATPNSQSIRAAVSFVRLLDDKIIPPEPMLLGSGNAALFWDEGGLYADIEFLGDGRIAYYIKRNADKHKGVLSFDSQNMPPLFPALIKV